MEDTLARIWEHLVGRLSGPLAFRLLLQPAMSTLFAIRDGLRDARSGRPPFLGTILGSPDDRRRLIREGLIAIGKLAALAIVIDFVYQLIVFRRIYPAEAIDVAVLLAIVPYFVLRGPVSRIARLWIRPGERASDEQLRPGGQQNRDSEGPE
jgi:hypothetical protein